MMKNRKAVLTALLLIAALLSAANFSRKPEKTTLPMQNTGAQTDVYAPPEACRNRILTLELQNGSVFQLGTDAPKTDYLYLNPEYTGADAEHPAAVWVESGRNAVEFDILTGSAGSVSERKAASVFAVLGAAADQSAPAQYRSRNCYGIRWRNRREFDGAEREKANTAFAVRLVEKNEGKLLASLTVNAVWDKKNRAFVLRDLKDGEVLQTGALTVKQRQDLVEDALRQLHDREQFPDLSAVTEMQWQQAAEQAVVDQPIRPWSRQVYTADSEPVFRGAFPDCRMYGVNFYLPGYGTLTLYYASRCELLGLKPPAEEKLSFFAYEPYPQTTTEAFTARNPALRPDY